MVVDMSSSRVHFRSLFNTDKVHGTTFKATMAKLFRVKREICIRMLAAHGLLLILMELVLILWRIYVLVHAGTARVQMIIVALAQLLFQNNV